ncbi:unnamed protein product [Cylindrotheca closterium]|uniref:Uncharacterized protein n=1 Tax=Cylindrotheca closterium TaxID=2856 RepID=A0AAD2FLG2_9STRA|nr:unnamed protein product [Cylindrotheca closterium]
MIKKKQRETKRKPLANKAKAVKLSKYATKNPPPSLQDLIEKMTIRSRSRPAELENPATVPFDMLLAADNILSRTEAGGALHPPLIPPVPETHGQHRSVVGSPNNQTTRNHGAITRPCFVIPSHGAKKNAPKTNGETSASVHSIPFVLDDPSASNYQPLKPRAAVSTPTHAANHNDGSSECRPIPPPPRLPSVPIGFAFSSSGTLSSLSSFSSVSRKSSARARSTVSKQ